MDESSLYEEMSPKLINLGSEMTYSVWSVMYEVTWNRKQHHLW